MNLSESFERYSEGLKKAVDRCKELGKASKNKDWDAIASHLEGLLIKGKLIYDSKGLSNVEKEKLLNQFQSVQVSKNG